LLRPTSFDQYISRRGTDALLVVGEHPLRERLPALVLDEYCGARP
jgi:hypothetical protein